MQIIHIFCQIAWLIICIWTCREFFQPEFQIRQVGAQDVMSDHCPRTIQLVLKIFQVGFSLLLLSWQCIVHDMNCFTENKLTIKMPRHYTVGPQNYFSAWFQTLMFLLWTIYSETLNIHKLPTHWSSKWFPTLVWAYWLELECYYAVQNSQCRNFKIW